VGALALGRAIRQAGLDTYVGGTYNSIEGGWTAANLKSMGECYSACVWAFAGGVHRFFDANGGVVGVHQFAFSGERTNDQKNEGEGIAQYLMTAIGMYLDEMGVSRRLLDWAALVPPNTIQPLPRAIAEQFQLDNSGDQGGPRLSAHPPTPRSDLERSFPLDWLEVLAGKYGTRYFVARGSLTQVGAFYSLTAKVDDGGSIQVVRWVYDRTGGRLRTDWENRYDQKGRLIDSVTTPSDWNSPYWPLEHDSPVELCYRALAG
jgi:hypothetical protein